MKWKGGGGEFKKHITYSLKDLMINWKASQQKINVLISVWSLGKSNKASVQITNTELKISC